MHYGGILMGISHLYPSQLTSFKFNCRCSAWAEITSTRQHGLQHGVLSKSMPSPWLQWGALRRLRYCSRRTINPFMIRYDMMISDMPLLVIFNTLSNHWWHRVIWIGSGNGGKLLPSLSTNVQQTRTLIVASLTLAAVCPVLFNHLDQTPSPTVDNT